MLLITQFNNLNYLQKYTYYNKNFIHSSSILNSDLRNIIITEDGTLRTDDRLSNLQLIKYNGDTTPSLANAAQGVEENSEGLNLSSFGESFPWLMDENGKVLDYNQTVNLDNAVKLISHFLEKKYGVDKSLFPENILTELFEPIKNNKDLTIIEFYNHTAAIFSNNKDMLSNLLLENTPLSPSGKGADVLDNSYLPDGSVTTNILNSSKPLGSFGDTTLNEIAIGLRDLKWEFIYNTANITVNALPLAMNLVGYGLILKSYVKHVHSRPFDSNFTDAMRLQEQLRRNRQLAIFGLVGIPAILVGLRVSAVTLKDVFTINFSNKLETNENSTIENAINNGFILLFLSNVNKKIPSWVKLFFKLFFLTLLILKLLGFNILEFFSIVYYVKIYTYTTCSLAILYNLLNIYLIHKFSNKTVIIPDVLPEFIINWLKEFELISTSKAYIKEAKKSSYIDISIYVLIIIFLILFT